MRLPKSVSRREFDQLVKAARFSLKNPGRSKRPLPKDERSGYSHIYLFRHTQTFDNVRRIFSGRRNSRLTVEGIKQAKGLAEKLRHKKIDLIFASPLVRCQQTAQLVLKYHPKARLVMDPLILERDYGRLSGKNKEKLMRENFEKAVLYRRAYDFPPPGGESLKQVEKRVKSFYKKILKLAENEPGISIGISATNNTMRLLRMFFENLNKRKMQTIENPYGDYAAYSLK